MDKFLQQLGPLGNIDFNKLFLGQVLSHFADAAAQFIFIAMILQNLDGAGKTVSMLFFAFLLPQFLLSPFVGALADKFSRKWILSLSNLFRGMLLVFAISFGQKIASPDVLYALSFLLGIGAAFFYTTKMAAVTNVVKSSELKFANAINAAIVTVATLFGALVAKFLFVKLGATASFVVIAGMYITASVVLAFIKFQIPQKFGEAKEGFIASMKSVFAYQKIHKRASAIIGTAIILSFLIAIFSNNLNSLVTDYYGMEFSDLTHMRTLLGVGILLGMGLTVFLARFVRIPHLFALGFIIFFLVLFTSPMCQRIETAWIWLFPIGISYSMLLIMISTVLQKIIPDRIRGKVFGFQLTMTTASIIVGTVLSAGISDKVHPLDTLKLIAFVALALAVLILLFDKDFRYFLLEVTLGQLFTLLFRYRVEGIEHLLKKGKVILAGNHTGRLDPVIIQMATHRHLWFLAGPASFQVPVVRWMLKYLNVIPILPKHGTEALDVAQNKLKAGEAVVIFPEGRFTPDGNLSKFHRGVAVLAKTSGVPIVPFVIQGGFEAWGDKRTLPRIFGKLVIQFGQPITDLDEDEKEIVETLQERVSFMKNALERRAFYNISKKFHNNFLDLMQEKGDLYGAVDALALKTKTGYKELSYIEISRQAKNFANYLIENTGIVHGDRIAILTESRPEFAVGMFASIQTGAITVPLDVKLTVSELTSILLDCNPRVIFASSYYLEIAKQLKENVKSIEQIFVLDDDVEVDVARVSDIKTDINKDLGVPRTLDDTALIVYTSGTMGNPKGVMISFGNIYSQLRDFEAILKINERHTILSVLPLNHLLELNVGFFGMFYMGAKAVYLQSLSPRELTSAMKEKQITNMLVVPLLVKMLKSSVEKEIRKSSPFAQKMFDIMYKIARFMPIGVRRIMFKSVIDGFGGKLENFVCGGAPLELEAGEFFERIGIPVYQGYGLTEASPTISTNYPGHNKLGTVGLPLPSVSVKLACNVNGAADRCTEGEILSIGPNVMQGYWGKPEMTKEVIDENGWLHTGDIGEIDKQGYIRITGRIKNMIVLGGGKKIFPEEVEAVLEYSPLVKELCVMSLKIKSGNRAGMEEVGIIIVPTDDLAKKTDEEIQKELEAEVKRLSEGNLAPYKQPTVVVVRREELPKTSTRKVKRQELLEWYESQT